ncbi:mttA/Hcf106 family-domain-containing protein [Scenedesmus sp. NREL 46B-D3]|nr:mttA/Hcf106 family-domain-containing protein [Scenedesmus sp. NREL 46B-D3]
MPRQNQLASVRPMPIGYGEWYPRKQAMHAAGQVMFNAAFQELRHKTVMQSFLGVGAPEAILVAVVALVVFGPKGLADAAKSLGQTLRAFQPTIREVLRMAKQLDPEIELKRAMSEQAAWGGQKPVASAADGSAAAAAAPEQQQQQAAAAAPAGQDLSKLSLSELEAELARRRKHSRHEVHMWTRSGSGW